jgi:succinate dehydrogenase (ubiquinone) iron-sulfur subunit
MRLTSTTSTTTAAVASAAATSPSTDKAPRLKTFSIYRWNPEVEGQKPYVKKYEVDLNEYVIKLYMKM